MPGRHVLALTHESGCAWAPSGKAGAKIRAQAPAILEALFPKKSPRNVGPMAGYFASADAGGRERQPGVL